MHAYPVPPMKLVDLTRYLAELSENNNRAWFVMNKPRYDILREEFLTLVTDVIAQISKFDPLVLHCNPKKALFRINRDVRFSHDKSPYKTSFSAAIVPGDLKKPSQGGGPMYYFEFDAQGQLFFAIGEYMPPADRLKQIRNHITQHGASLTKIIKDNKLLTALSGFRQEGKLQRPPKGFEADDPHVELIKLKSYVVSNQVKVKDLNTTTLAKTLVSKFKTAYPLVCWLRQSRE